MRHLVAKRRGANHNKLTQETASLIRKLCREGATQSSVAERFGLAQQTISKIVNGEIWMPKI